MAEDELAGLSREELLELLAQRADVIGRQQAELAEHEAAIERRDEKIRELEDELAQFRRPAKTPENSSVPPSRAQKANRVAGRRRKLGPKRGHVGVSRARSEPDVVVECRPRTCAGCGQELPQTGGRRRGEAARSSTRTRPARGWPGATTGSGCSRRPRRATTSSPPAGAAR